MARVMTSLLRVIFPLALSTPAVARMVLNLHHDSLHLGEGREFKPTCSSLANKQTHFTVRIGVGTPPQFFDVVADTGSDSVIVNSCLCAQTGHCSPKDRCFQGEDQSSTFSLAEEFDAQSNATYLESIVITFGSGQVQAVIASDVVQVGKASAQMTEGLLLMVNKALNFDGPFEGILGLGIPKRQPKTMLYQSQQDAQAGAHEFYDPKGFLEEAGVPRFSMCFNYNQDGVLRLGGPEPKLTLGSVGKAHWGLDFRGISVVASESVAMLSTPADPPTAAVEAVEVRSGFCSEASKKPGQVTACGVIPDSGSTLMMGPKEHLIELFGLICDAWPTCQREAQKQSNEPKHKVFQTLLMRCTEWLPGGLDELPTLKFHVAGSDGKEEILEMPSNGYIDEIIEEEVQYVRANLMGVFPVELVQPTGKFLTVCTPAFGTMDYNTQLNGPVWILGTPLFYEYQVGYELNSQPPGLSFSTAECGACEDGEIKAAPNKTAFLTKERSILGGRHSRGQRLPRRISGPPRIPKFDTAVPL
mmetsp:Transcript_133052/g.332090  ORF Transcript_133052/g.332090 Transcript_133052/m.332090 type:complete len:529 (-) Transcript_133052:58-1644(-)